MIEPKLHFGKMKDREFAYRTLFFEIPAGIDLDEVQKPGFWVHYTRDIRPMDVVEVFPEDGGWEASFRVFFVSAEGVKMKLRDSVVYDEVEIEEDETDEYVVRWRGPASKFAIVHRESREVVQDKLYPKAEAIAQLRNHLKTMAA